MPGTREVGDERLVAEGQLARPRSGRAREPGAAPLAVRRAGSPRRDRAARGHELDRVDDPVVAGAAAEVAGQRPEDRLARGRRLAPEQRLRLHDDARRAEPALRRAGQREGIGPLAAGLGRQARRRRHERPANRVGRLGAASRPPGRRRSRCRRRTTPRAQQPSLTARRPQLVPQDLEQARARVGLDRHLASVERELQREPYRPPQGGLRPYPEPRSPRQHRNAPRGRTPAVGPVLGARSDPERIDRDRARAPIGSAREVDRATTRSGARARRSRRRRAHGGALPRGRHRAADLRASWPTRRPSRRRSASAWPAVDPDAPDPLNLFRVHWFNGPDRRTVVDVPAHVVLPPSLTGVEAPIVVLLGDRFPMIRSHKVLAAYGCLVAAPRDRPVRPDGPPGGLAVHRQLLPRRRRDLADPRLPRRRRPARGDEPGAVRLAGATGSPTRPTSSGRPARRATSRRSTTAAPSSIATPTRSSSTSSPSSGTTSPTTRSPAGRVESVVAPARRRAARPGALRAFVSATGSAGTIGGRRLPQGAARVADVAVEALECPTMLENGFGEHNIQGIGDKHIPLIHNVMTTDFVVGVSDRATDRLNVLFATAEGRDYLARRRGVDEATIAAFESFGLSSICNIVAAIKTREARAATARTTSSPRSRPTAPPMYETERIRIAARDFPGGFDAVAAGETFGEFLAGRRRRTTSSSCGGRSATGSSTSATSPGSSSRACRSRSSRRAGGRSSGPRPRSIVAALGPPDRGAQRADRRARGPAPGGTGSRRDRHDRRVDRGTAAADRRRRAPAAAAARPPDAPFPAALPGGRRRATTSTTS